VAVTALRSQAAKAFDIRQSYSIGACHSGFCSLDKAQQMSPIRKRGALRRFSLAVVSVAVLVFALVPAVNALCALAALDLGHSKTGVVQALAAPAVGAGDEGEPCCTAISATVVEASELFMPGLARAIQPVGAPLAAERVGRVLVLPRARAPRHSATPPPEPVSRRFPRLLI
jgi:hypothetical protein